MVESRRRNFYKNRGIVDLSTHDNSLFKKVKITVDGKPILLDREKIAVEISPSNIDVVYNTLLSENSDALGYKAWLNKEIVELKHKVSIIEAGLFLHYRSRNVGLCLGKKIEKLPSGDLAKAPTGTLIRHLIASDHTLIGEPIYTEPTEEGEKPRIKGYTGGLYEKLKQLETDLHFVESFLEDIKVRIDATRSVYSVWKKNTPID